MEGLGASQGEQKKKEEEGREGRRRERYLFRVALQASELSWNSSTLIEQGILRTPPGCSVLTIHLQPMLPCVPAAGLRVWFFPFTGKKVQRRGPEKL